MQIGRDTWVTVRYRLFDSSGQPVETGEREIVYLHGGYGSVFDKIESALEGRSAGDRESIYLEPQDSFGDYDAELVRLAPRERFPEKLEEGMTFESVPGEPDDGLLYIVTDIADTGVVLDANHPLAGMSLRFDLQVIEVRAASPEEIADELARIDAPAQRRTLH